MPPKRATAPKDVEEDAAADGDLEDLDDEELGDLDGDEDIDADALDDDDEVGDSLVATENEDEEGDETKVEILTPSPATVVERPADESEEEDDEEQDDEDVEASLDVILKERLVVEDEPDDEEPTDVEDRAEMTERVLPKQPDEFVCRSCFLVKHPSQLADKKKMLCRDCV
jgi:hypothetical protein